MPDPLNPSSSPSSKPEKKETVVDRTDTINVTYKKQNHFLNFIPRIILLGKNSTIKDVKDIIKPNLFRSSQVYSKSTLNVLGQVGTGTVPEPGTVPKPGTIPKSGTLSKPSFLTKLKALFRKIRLPSFLGGFKMSDKKPGRPMKYPYTLTAKLAQFPYKYYFNNNWMIKYYALAMIVSFPIFYKISKLSNSPENIKTWEEIRRRDFTPGPHHH